MLTKLLAFFGISKPLEASPCPRCSAPSFDGVCPSCFQRGEAVWQVRGQEQDRKDLQRNTRTDDDQTDH